MSNVIELGPRNGMTPEEVLALVARENPETMLIIFERDEKIFIRTSKLLNKDVLWLLEMAKINVLDGDSPDAED